MQRRAIVVVLAALDLDELRDQLPAAAVEEGVDGSALRFQAKPAGALPLGADAKVTDEFAVMLGINLCSS